MRTLCLIIFTLFVSTNAFAQQFELPLANPNSAKEVETVLNKIKASKDELFNVGNGQVFTDTYDTKAFDAEAYFEKVSAVDPEDYCTYTVEQGEAAWKTLIDFEAEDGPSDGNALLKKLRASGETVFVYSKTWDGEGDKSEGCSKTIGEAYFKNGQVLNVDFDFTD